MSALTDYLSERERRADAATKGPWEQMAHKYLSFDCGETPQVFRAATDDDETFIRDARDSVPKLCAMLKLADSELERITGCHGDAADIARAALARLDEMAEAPSPQHDS